MRFIPAAHHSAGSNSPVNRVVIHATCPDVGFPSASRAGRAVSTANYFASPSSGGSAHYVCDVGETVQCLSEGTIGWHAPPNPHSLGIEICADGGSHASFKVPGHAYTREQWLSPQVWPAVEKAAILCRRLCDKHNVPKRKLSAADLKAGKRGVCGHVDVTDAWHQSDHDDPGPWFPWDKFMAVVCGGSGSDSGELTVADVKALHDQIKQLSAQLTGSVNKLHHDVGVVQVQNGDLGKRVDSLSWVKNPVTGKLWRTRDALWSVWYYVLECRSRIGKLESDIAQLKK
ncbi:endolysin [Propionibacterium phage Kubed]|uniref:N-acetylmuramoyl-L-alanine amidase n=1 Tax=Propionibacterium phage Kubed TaxID=1655014 RepID=A0A0H4IRN8_9CAUD|nr:endolysin [Propionibacterium phage Kubed]AKO60295.1 lysin [Propionibacterium phage Kubed]